MQIGSPKSVIRKFGCIDICNKRKNMNTNLISSIIVVFILILGLIFLGKSCRDGRDNKDQKQVTARVLKIEELKREVVFLQDSIDSLNVSIERDRDTVEWIDDFIQEEKIKYIYIEKKVNEKIRERYNSPAPDIVGFFRDRKLSKGTDFPARKWNNDTLSP